MKKNKTQNISLKKLTIARISTDSMKRIEGGTSVVTSQQPEDGEIVGYCYDIK
ncbi:class I lanthipeptide [Aquimarina rubra]|uniref:Class I lanthipeptide n=1 Tax=Aquimarina rubra TaxID=1920033 RepID=A0ABW5LDE2_9FLAO